jgi:hypothetical protein
MKSLENFLLSSAKNSLLSLQKRAKLNKESEEHNEET